nr:GHKL domain-containing protein [uncultured Blautia sp.]
MLTLKIYLLEFTGSLISHAVLAVYLFVIMGTRGRRVLKKLPALLLSPLLAVLLGAGLYALSPNHGVARYCMSTFAILLMCTFWVRWAWRTEFWRAFSAVCMGGVFQMATSCLSQILILYSDLPFAAVMAIYLAVVPAFAILLYRLRFGHWFRLLLGEGFGQRRVALFFFALEVAMEAFLILQVGIQPQYLIPYYLLVLMMAALIAGLVIYLAQRLDAARKLEAQQDMIAQQQLYERDLVAIRQEVRSFRHDYKNLLAGLSQQADEGELDQLRTALSELDTGFDRHIGEKIRASTQIGNVCVPQVRSLLLSKLAAMGEQKIDCRMEVLYPVERVGMDPWDFTRCLGILLDNAAEAALETDTPWVEIVLLSQKGRLSLRVSNPYTGAVDPDKIWTEGFSTKGEGRGLGLPGYQRILADYPNAASSTGWAGSVFIQELTVEEKA